MFKKLPILRKMNYKIPNSKIEFEFFDGLKRLEGLITVLSTSVWHAIIYMNEYKRRPGLGAKFFFICLS